MEDSTAGASPAGTTIYEDADVLTVGEDDFENLLDEPFITVNRIGSKYEGEVILSGDHALDEARVERALDVGRSRGVHAYARKHGGDSVLIFFTANTVCRE